MILCYVVKFMATHFILNVIDQFDVVVLPFTLKVFVAENKHIP